MGTVRDLITVNGLAFNDPAVWGRQIDTMEGWEGTPGMEMVLVPNGGGHGAVLGASPVVKERYITCGGAWATDSREAAEQARNTLLDALPLGVEFPVERYGRVAFCLLYDQVEVDLITPRGFRFTAPLVALDPLRYLPGVMAGGPAAPYTGIEAYRTYSGSATYMRTYTGASSYARTYDLPTGAVNEVRLTNPGNATSRRVTLTIAGPVPQGDWRVVNTITGESVWLSSGLGVGQTLVLDGATDTAAIDGADTTHTMYGTIPGLAPGENVYRLLTSDPTATGTLTVTAYAAER